MSQHNVKFTRNKTFSSSGKDEKDCMFEQTGLGLFIFDENKLIAVSFFLICNLRSDLLLFVNLNNIASPFIPITYFMQCPYPLYGQVHDYERSFPAVLDIYKFW